VEQFAEVPQGPSQRAAGHESKSSPNGLDVPVCGRRATLSGLILYRIREAGRREAPDFLKKAGDAAAVSRASAAVSGRSEGNLEGMKRRC
jgi:hypothetical protein